MMENQWKLVVDGDGVTIASDRFRLTAPGVAPTSAGLVPDEAVLQAMESTELEGVISELQSMTRRTYGQFCGVSRAMEMIGERWALLIVRDLLVGPKTFTDLTEGFPRLSIDVLCARLREMEHFGIVTATMADGEMTYALTEFGAGLDEIVMALGRWGAATLDEPRPEDVVTENGLITALRATFQPAAAVGVVAGVELRLGDVVIHALIADGAMVPAMGPLPGADLTIELTPAFKKLMAGELTPAQAIENGQVTLIGDESLFPAFVSMFQIV